MVQLLEGRSAVLAERLKWKPSPHPALKLDQLTDIKFVPSTTSPSFSLLTAPDPTDDEGKTMNYRRIQEVVRGVNEVAPTVGVICRNLRSIAVARLISALYEQLVDIDQACRVLLIHPDPSEPALDFSPSLQESLFHLMVEWSRLKVSGIRILFSFQSFHVLLRLAAMPHGRPAACVVWHTPPSLLPRPATLHCREFALLSPEVWFASCSFVVDDDLNRVGLLLGATDRRSVAYQPREISTHPRGGGRLGCGNYRTRLAHRFTPYHSRTDDAALGLSLS